VERYLFTYLTTGRDLLRMQAHASSQTDVTVVADPYFDDPEKQQGSTRPVQSQLAAQKSETRGQAARDLSGVYFSPLAGTKLEAESIRALFPNARLLMGAQATKAAILRLEAPSILHLATHGFFLADRQTGGNDTARSSATDSRSASGTDDVENPLLRSGLALSGANVQRRGGERGILTALEAANLNLWGTKLVTLSACDTGIGEVRAGEGVFGLRRAFVLSGAESLVMSLWPVSDYTTRQMITSYYTGLKNGRGRGEALRQAELAMMQRRGREHPSYWASFIESGEWANLNGRR
jgi:CHAT domain-containing protein